MPFCKPMPDDRPVKVTLRVYDGHHVSEAHWHTEVNHWPVACNTLPAGGICTLAGQTHIADGVDPLRTPELRLSPSLTQWMGKRRLLRRTLAGLIWYWNRSATAVERVGHTIPARTLKLVAGTGEAASGRAGPRGSRYGLPKRIALPCAQRSPVRGGGGCWTCARD